MAPAEGGLRNRVQEKFLRCVSLSLAVMSCMCPQRDVCVNLRRLQTWPHLVKRVFADLFKVLEHPELARWGLNAIANVFVRNGMLAGDGSAV
jgi:hypothetical protein